MTIDELYEEFLSKITSHTLLSEFATEEEIREELDDYLKSSIRRFYKCKADLTIIVNEETQSRSFVDELGFEVEVLIALMLVEYAKSQMISDEAMKQSLSDKSFKVYSQANQLRELRLLYKELKKEAEKLITDYTYIPLYKGEKL